MKKFFHFMALAAMMLVIPACSDKDPEPDEGGNSGSGTTVDKGDLYIEQQYLAKNFSKSSQTYEIPVETQLASSKWYTHYDASWLLVTKKGPTNGQGTVTISVQENKGEEAREAVVKIESLTKSYSVTIKQYGNTSLVVEGDFPVKPVDAKATNYQGGSNIDKSYDDDVTTMFHSNWSQTNKFPFILQYDFMGQDEINYIEYVPRQGGGNGAFQTFELYYATNSARTDWTKVGDYDFKGSAATSRMDLPAGVKPTSVKFSVNSGVGGYVSCAEMRFFRVNNDKALDKELLNVFTDLTCSELKPGVTLEQIQALSQSFFVRVAEELYHNNLNPLEQEFRVHEYSSYSNPTDWNGPLMTKVYSNLDNPMGIWVKRGEDVVICVGDTHGYNVGVQLVGENTGTTDKGTTWYKPQAQGTYYTLNEGVNLFKADKEGQLFFMYTATPCEATQKIKVHVPVGCGEFAGYFDLLEHKTNEKFREIRALANHKYMTIKGERMILYFLRSKLPTKILDPIQQWDNIITWQQNFMGIEDVRPNYWNNHLLGIMLQGDGYMWASDYCMGFIDYKMDDIMGLEAFNANADNAWGPAHEMGHVNQKAINWMSTTESSNNLFSNYVLYRFGRYSSRGKSLYYRFGAVYEKDHSWASMNYEGTHTGANPPFDSAANTYMGEETGIHMRLNWQLWNVYHRVMGDEKFFGRVFKIMRELGMNETDDPGAKQLEYAVACSQAAGENLTDFFEAWGFFKPVNGTIEQYGKATYRVTTQQINDAKERMAKFPKPKYAVEYIEDRYEGGKTPGDFGDGYTNLGQLGYYTTYQNNLKVASNASARVTGKKVSTSNCDAAVAIEIRNNNTGKVVYASNFKEFTVPTSNFINTSGCGVYAVQCDGERILLCNM